jgi:hypothetical protein
VAARSPRLVGAAPRPTKPSRMPIGSMPRANQQTRHGGDARTHAGRRRAARENRDALAARRRAVRCRAARWATAAGGSGRCSRCRSATGAGDGSGIASSCRKKLLPDANALLERVAAEAAQIVEAALGERTAGLAALRDTVTQRQRDDRLAEHADTLRLGRRR